MRKNHWLRWRCQHCRSEDGAVVYEVCGKCSTILKVSTDPGQSVAVVHDTGWEVHIAGIAVWSFTEETDADKLAGALRAALSGEAKP